LIKNNFIFRYEDAWDIGILLADSNQWVKAANAALNDFRLDFGNITLVNFSVDKSKHGFYKFMLYVYYVLP